MLTMPNGRSKFLSIKNDPFLKGYYGRLFYRPSCGACQFAQSERVSDITLGDAWHIEKKYPAWNNCGVSCIIVNSPQGEKVVEQITPAMELHSEELEWVIENNSQFTTPTQMHKKREIFFGQLDSMPFSKAVKKAMNENLSSKIMRKIFSWQ